MKDLQSLSQIFLEIKIIYKNIYKIIFFTKRIQNATIKDNILFGRPYDEEFYKKVLKLTTLQSDIEIFPAGDLTEIGEKVWVEK